MPNTIDSRDSNAPWNRDQLPKLTREEEQDEYISELRQKIKEAKRLVDLAIDMTADMDHALLHPLLKKIKL